MLARASGRDVTLNLRRMTFAMLWPMSWRISVSPLSSAVARASGENVPIDSPIRRARFSSVVSWGREGTCSAIARAACILSWNQTRYQMRMCASVMSRSLRRTSRRNSRLRPKPAGSRKAAWCLAYASDIAMRSGVTRSARGAVSHCSKLCRSLVRAWIESNGGKSTWRFWRRHSTNATT